MVHVKQFNNLAKSKTLKYIAKNMRQSDIDELDSASGLRPFECLKQAVSISSFVYVIEGKKPLGIFGVTKQGIVWMLATNKIKKHPSFLKTFHVEYLKRWLLIYKKLYNYVHNDNEVSKKWLKKCGFVLNKPEPFGIKKELFCYFSMGEKNV